MSNPNKALVHAVIDRLFNRKELGAIASFYARDCRGSSPDGEFRDRDGFCDLFENYVTAFPDFRVEIETMVAERDLVTAQYTFTGTHTGALSGSPATGHVVRIPGIVLSRVENQQIVEQVFLWDNLAPRRQARAASIMERLVNRR
jgi:steroid delta-isomerase-like uncharacterized protein